MRLVGVPWSWRSQLTSWFQLVKIWVTSSNLLIRYDRNYDPKQLIEPQASSVRLVTAAIGLVAAKWGTWPPLPTSASEAAQRTADHAHDGRRDDRHERQRI